MKKKKLPESFRAYFWDVDFDAVEKCDYIFIINRILDYGNTFDIRWLLKHYTKKNIKKVLHNSQNLSRKTANFWADLLDIDKSKVPALKKSYIPPLPLNFFLDPIKCNFSMNI